MEVKRKLTLFCLSLAAVPIFAQTLWPTTDEKGRKGFADESGEIVIKCKYDEVTPFNEDGVSIVKKDDKYGMINQQGKAIVKVGYSEISQFYKGVARISDGSKWGLVSSDGTFVLKPKYDYIGQFNGNGVAWIAKDLKEKNGAIEKALFGLIDYNGQELAKPIYSAFYYETPPTTKDAVRNEYAMDIAELRGKHPGVNAITNLNDVIWQGSEYLIFISSKNENGPGLMKSDGTVLVSPADKITSGISYPSSGMYVAYTYDEKKRTLSQFYASVDGNRKIDVNTETFKKKQKYYKKNLWLATNFFDNVAYIGRMNPNNRLESKGYFIDKDGKTIVDNIKDYNVPAEGKIVVRNLKEEYGLLGTEGKMLVDFGRYTGMFDFCNGFAAVKKDGKWGYIDHNCECKVPALYESVWKKMNKYHYAIAKKNGKWGATSIEGRNIVPFSFLNLNVVDEKTFWVMKEDSLMYFYDLPSKKIISQGFKEMYYVNVTTDSTALLKNNLAVVSPATAKSEKDVIVVRRNGEVLFPLPLNVSYKNLMIQCVEDNDCNPVKKGLAHSVVLKTTRKSRSYGLLQTIPADDWDF